ncbi:hypothetical protein TNCV_418291 [Trichonephila clavipes]|nr:hypothetical protein TNCV_418291 [Trichonephila clavipes]
MSVYIKWTNEGDLESRHADCETLWVIKKREMPNWLKRRRVETDGSSATLRRTVSTLYSVRIFRWAPLPGRSATETQFLKTTGQTPNHESCGS